MASSTTGERRWASAKRGGMTVLGKVAVPKPINLPSQRLENHGLDPNVEIVPKGSLSWGARSSPAGSNPWGTSSVLSPRTEGGSTSPSHPSGRPSSGGGTRPSTAGSERTPDPSSVGAWPPNSRPSSASGVLASNNSSLMALRPHSAETRPGSSQLSRFADPLAEDTAPWGASGSADKLGMAAPAKDGFSLSSGDFPTLGSEKDSGKNMECIDQNPLGSSGSSSCRPSATTEKVDATLDVKSGLDDSWKNDGPQYAADSSHPGMERWHGDSHPYPNPNIPPHPYETWQGGAPINSPAGVWFRGPPGVPYGAPPMVAPGGFPMEPFPYYRPPVPAPGLLNSQAVPPHSVGPRGPHSKNGDLCRPIMEPYMRPNMPIRPGFYPGYYGPPMGFCNPNERDLPFMGMPTGPPIYNRYPNQNAPEPSNLNARSSDGRTLEQGDYGPPRRHYNVPAKQIMGWDRNIEEDKCRPCDKGYAANSSQENVWSEDQDHRKDEQMNHGKFPSKSEEAFPVLPEDKIGSIQPSSVKFHGKNSSGESTDVNHVVENDDMQRGHKLIQKIEGLNAKARGSDGAQDIFREEPEPYSRGHLVNSKASHPIDKPNAGIHLERHYPSGILVPVSRDTTTLDEDKGFGSTVRSVTNISRNFSNHLQGKGDHGGRGRFKSQKSAISESPSRIAVVSSERTSNIHGKELHPTIQSTVMSGGSSEEVKDDSTLSASDSSDSQRSKMREIAKQRAIQLQQEEEERIREQKAKALAKLEELNRRSANQGKETSNHQMDSIPSHSGDLQKQEESNIKIELHFGSFRSGEEVSTSLGYIPSKASKLLEPDKPSGVIFPEANAVADPQNVQVHEFSSQKRAGYKQKNIHPAKNMSEKPVLDTKDSSASSSTVTVLKEVDGKNVPSFSESNLPVDSLTITDSLVHPKRKNNRAGKIKHKVDEPPAISSASVQKEFDASKSVNESLELKTVEAKLEPVQTPADSKDADQSFEIHPSLPHDDAPHRGNNSWKPQHVRKLPRNSQGRIVEKSHSNDAVVWAPVRSHNKIEVIDDVDQKAEEGAIPSTRTDNSVPSSSKSKRAEMERYVPKAAMREPVQQRSIQLSTSPSREQSIPDGMSSSKGQASSQIAERAGRPMESSHVESKHKQTQTQTQTHGSRRKHGSAESNFVRVSGDTSSSMMNPTKNFQASDEQHMTQKPKELPKGSTTKPIAQPGSVQPSKQDEWPAKQLPSPGEVNEGNFEDGWHIVDEPVSSLIFSGAKDHGTSGRGKRNPYKGHKGIGNPQNFGSKYHKAAEADAHYYSETNQADRPTSSKGKNVAQWQPKSQTNVANQLGDGANGRQTVSSEGNKISKRGTSASGGFNLKQHNNQDTAKGAGQRQISSAPENKDVPRMPNIGTQDLVVERKAAPPKDRSYSPTEDTVIEVKSAPVGHSDGTNNEQRLSSSGQRRNGNYNGRHNRGHEFHGDQSFITQENRQNYAPANREKPRQNSRYEYQPVRPDNKSEGQTENQHAGPRFRDQHQGTHMRRGGGRFYGRQRGNYQTNAGYE